MKITFLGHAGFFVETNNTILIMDPWVSENGAFDGGWFQYPRNHHMADFITTNLQNNNDQKEVFIYISHEHKDHFDVPFQQSIQAYDFKYIIPNFRRTILKDQLQSFSSKEIVVCDDEHLININTNEFIKIYADDSELNRDSAIFFQSYGKKFLNLNDCKIHDRLGRIQKELGTIDVFTVQFSGATWHPTCYEYPEKEYSRISKKKKLSKFEATALAIESIQPKTYIPSAGPACFLDPDTIHLNFQKNNIFPRSPEIISYLDKRLKKIKPLVQSMMPQDRLDVADEITFVKGPSPEITEAQFPTYIHEYANDYTSFFNNIKQVVAGKPFEELCQYLKNEFQAKLDNFKSRNQITRPLHFEFIDQPSIIFKIDFANGKVTEVHDIPETDFYRIKVFAYDIQRIKDGFLTWEDYSLTFRMKLNRAPDVYQVLMQGFLILEKEDLNFFCDKILEIENRNERITVEVGGCKYRIDRYCPHQGADLKYSWNENDKFLVCPRHRWEFDLENGGICPTNSASINAVPLEED